MDALASPATLLNVLFADAFPSPQAGAGFTALPEHTSAGKPEPSELQELAAARQAAGQPPLTAGEVAALRWRRRLMEVWAPRMAWWVGALDAYAGRAVSLFTLN